MSQLNGLLIWSDPKDWNAAVHRFLDDCITKDIRSQVVKNPEMYFFDEGTTWPDDQPIPLLINNQKVSGASELLEAFQQTYPRIRMFHGCRTDDITSYLRNGLCILSVDDQTEKAKKLFLNDQFPQITEADIMAAKIELDNQGRQNSVCLLLDDSSFINRTSQYLEYGGEYIAGIASYLSRVTGLDCMNYLRSIGTPTVFICEVPLLLVKAHTAFNLLILLLNSTIYEQYGNNEDKPTTGFGFTFYRPIPPKFIATYYQLSK